MKIGVFDSGVGGLSVANAIRRALPGHEVLLREDAAHLPYGTKKPDEIFGFVVPLFAELINAGCGIIVVACNTVSTTLIGRIRERFPDTQFVAIEPMVKPAAKLTKSGVIAVCATPTTLASPRYAQLKQEYSQGVRVLEPDCSDWASMIEHKRIEEQEIEKRITETLEQGADVIVLGCTHYHWIEETIDRITAGKAKVLQPESAVVEQLRRALGV